MGWSEPLDDERLTHGICVACTEDMLGLARPHQAAVSLRQTSCKNGRGKAIRDPLEPERQVDH
jgi:hypothetical protein